MVDGNHPFGVILVDEKGNILLEQGNIEVTARDCTGHAETILMQRASQQYDKDFPANCTLYTTAEPCVMCAGAMYWGNVLRLVYGITEEQLLAETGDDPRNSTLSLDCRTVFSRGQKQIEVIGPVPDVLDAQELTSRARNPFPAYGKGLQGDVGAIAWRRATMPLRGYRSVPMYANGFAFPSAPLPTPMRWSGSSAPPAMPVQRRWPT